MRFVAEQNTVATALRFRLLIPFLPDAVPMPGDRALRRAVRNIDSIILPLVRAERARDDGGDDFVASLARAATRTATRSTTSGYATSVSSS